MNAKGLIAFLNNDRESQFKKLISELEEADRRNKELEQENAILKAQIKVNSHAIDLSKMWINEERFVRQK